MLIYDEEEDELVETEETEAVLIDEVDDAECVDIDEVDDEKVVVTVIYDIEKTDDEIEVVEIVGEQMQQIIDDEVVDFVEMVVNEWQKYVIQQTEATDLRVLLVDNAVILVIDIVCIDLHLTEHLLL